MVLGKTLFLGDSDIEGWNINEPVPGSYNLGVGGATCADVFSWSEQALNLLSPKRVVLVCGENDLWDYSVSRTFTDFQKVVNKLIEGGGVEKIVYMSTKPEPDTKELHNKYQLLDAKIKEFALATSQLTLVDSYNGFLDLGNPNNLYQSDLLHLSSKGYALWDSWVVSALNDDQQCSYWRSGIGSNCNIGTGNSDDGGSGGNGSGGFDWGEGCLAGSGAFTQNLPVQLSYADVGEIPRGKWDIQVQLRASVDLDITLFDLEDISEEYPEGKAIVAWCSGTGCNSGVLGMSSKPAEATYKGMTVKYSGYNGINGERGNEYIEITGETSTKMMMKAFAYKTGTAEVTYEWGESKSDCCLKIGPCGGSFLQPIPLNNIITIGEIPVGKSDVYINLRSTEDVDIQIYDMDDTSNYSEGQAIVAWCAGFGCNKGVLNGSREESKFYPLNSRPSLLYTYSGYNGQNGQRGDEFIQIHGMTNRRLLMTAYGYKAGVANVTYSYIDI